MTPNESTIESLAHSAKETLVTLATDLSTIPGFVDAFATYVAGIWATSDFAKMRGAQGLGEEKVGSEYAMAGCVKFAVAGGTNALLRGDFINLLSQTPFLLGSFAEYLEHHPELLKDSRVKRAFIILGSLPGVLATSAATGGLGLAANMASGEFEDHPATSLVKVLGFGVSQSGYALRESKNGLAKGLAHTFGNGIIAVVSFLEILYKIQAGLPVNHASIFWGVSSTANTWNSAKGLVKEGQRLIG